MNNSLKIAMWSGPRNISTTLMRSFSMRNDTAVIDEPFYAYFLKQTDTKHPDSDKIIKSYLNNYNEIVKKLTGEIPDNKRIYYQKQMTQHKLPDDNMDWIKHTINTFLIRDPAKVIHSYRKIHDKMTPELLGFPQINDIFESAKKYQNSIPLVINSDDILKNPEKSLKVICEKLNIKYQKEMLSWEKGKHENDGMWGKYWYKNLYNSTGFKPYKSTKTTLHEKYYDLYEKCLDYYNNLSKYALKIN